MMTLTLQDIPLELNDALQKRADELHRPMAEVAVEAMKAGLGLSQMSPAATATTSLAAAIRARFAPLGGVELPESIREPMREPSSFHE